MIPASKTKVFEILVALLLGAAALFATIGTSLTSPGSPVTIQRACAATQVNAGVVDQGEASSFEKDGSQETN